MKPKISIVIPLLNKGPHVERCLRSVLSQSIQDFEIIVVDGGSTDNGPQIVNNFGDSRIVFFQQTGKGVSAARNQGVSTSHGELVAFLDADDEWTPLHLEKLLILRKKYPEAGAYTTAYQIIQANGKLRMANYKAIPPCPWEGLIPDYFKSGTLGEYPVWTSVSCVPRQIFYEMKGFPEDAWYGEDADLFGKIAIKYSVAFSWYIGGIYHMEAVNRACNKEISLKEEPFVITARKAMNEGNVPREKLTYLNEYIEKKEMYRAERNLNSGKTKTAYKILKSHKSKSFRHRRLILRIIIVIYPSLYNKIYLWKTSKFI